MIKIIIFIMRGFLILFMIFIFSSSFVYAGSLPGTDLDFADEWKGTFSGYTNKAYLVIDDETEWQEVWDKAFPTESVPDIDFDDYIVIAVFMGKKTYSGYKAYINHVYDETYTLNHPHVAIHESYNRSGSSRAVQPYHIVALQRDDFPEDTDFDDTEFDIGTVLKDTNNSNSSSPYYSSYPYSSPGYFFSSPFSSWPSSSFYSSYSPWTSYTPSYGLPAYSRPSGYPFTSYFNASPYSWDSFSSGSRFYNMPTQVSPYYNSSYYSGYSSPYFSPAQVGYPYYTTKGTEQ